MNTKTLLHMTKTVELIGGPRDGETVEIDLNNAPKYIDFPGLAFHRRPYRYVRTRTYASREATIPNGVAYVYLDVEDNDL